jgi:wyosine [tRNA(Phe)-imidazoG37] synthetase (radical SAM superfamily)
MQDELNIDSHKLMYHPEEVSEWRHGRTIEPLYLEVSPSGACNHRCKFCALDYTKYTPNMLNVPDYIKYLDSFTEKPLAVMFAGEGEPLMNKNIVDIIAATKSRGIDCALTTNGILLKQDLASKVLPMLSWIKISVDAANAEDYSLVHGTSLDDWNRLWINISNLDIRATCKVGLQYLLTKYNDGKVELESFISRAKSVGVDYVVIKAYSKHLMSNNALGTLNPKTYLYLKQKYETGYFKVILRSDNSERKYKQCLSLPFWRYIQADGNIWACSAHLGNIQFVIGDIRAPKELRLSFEKDMNEFIKTFDIKDCRLNCRMNNCNEYLWRLKNPLQHDNFI